MSDERDITKERDIAQSTCGAWQNVFESIEAHIKDHIDSKDEVSPETYLRIIQSDVASVYNDSRAIARCRWADYARQSAEIERLRETLTAVRDTIEHNPDSINEGAIVCTVWFSPIETMVDFIDAALNFHAVGEKE